MSLAVATPLLFRFPLPTVERLLAPRRRRPRLDEATALWAADVALRVVRRPLHPTCLHRGAVRYYLLRRAGIDVRLIFGIGHDGQTATGHCWLVRDGQPFLETVDPRSTFTGMHAIGGPLAAVSGTEN